MKFVNTKNGIIISNRIEIADNPFRRMKGLLGRDSLDDEEGLLIVPCNGIHSFFMKFPFDAVFLSRENRVLHIIENMPAWRNSPFVKGARSVLELAPGRIKKCEISVGDLLEGF